MKLPVRFENKITLDFWPPNLELGLTHAHEHAHFYTGYTI